MQFLYASFDQVPSFKGASTHILANCRALLRRHVVTLVTLGDTALPASGAFSHLPCAIREGNYLQSGLSFRRRISELLKMRRFDAIQFRTPWEGLAAVRSKIPCIYELNGVPSIEVRSLYPEATERSLDILYAAEQECLETAGAIVCHTPKTVQYLVRERGIAPEKITLIPNGYDPAPYPAPASRSNSSILRMVYLGTLSPWQGLPWSLPVFRNYRGAFTLDIFGPLRKNNVRELRRRLRKLKLEIEVRHLGTLPKYALVSTLAQYDLAFAPFMKDARNAVQGSCPVKLLDYKNASLPILTSLQKITEPFVFAPAEGVCYAPNSLRSLRETLEALLERRYDLEAMRAESRRSLERFPTWEQSGSRLLEVCGNLGVAA